MNDHNCSFFKKQRDVTIEESEGWIASGKKVYKFIMNKHVKESTKVVEPVMKERGFGRNHKWSTKFVSSMICHDHIDNREQNYCSINVVVKVSW